MTRSVEVYSVRWRVFSFAKAEAMELVPEHTSRALNREFEDKLAVAVMRRCVSKLFLPAPITTALAVFRSVKYIREGLSALLARHGCPSPCWTPPLLRCPWHGAILPPQALSCSCCIWAKFWRSGRTKSPWPTLPPP